MNTEIASGSDVRVRFCPSPTGTPHVGMVRTCIFNWAYARHCGGTFVFRIEDTDAARDSEESFNQILESLNWLGIDWDEGVGKGGPHEPYRQSQRMDIYKQVADKLLQAGFAYKSYSTPEEVKERHLAAGRNPELGYDGFDRDITEEQIAAFEAEGREPVLRLRMPDEDITFTDLVRGEVTFKKGSVPDYVIVRGNGQPLYTLVNPVDDALMEITHVLRGEDLLSSTPRQIVLYRALQELGICKTIPQFGHLPYVMGEGNKKLSKRDPESNLLIHRKNGMLPEGILNYLALLGWSIAADRDVFSAKEIVEAFDISAVNANPARFDPKKCIAINAEHIRLLDTQDFRDRLVPYLYEEEVVSAPDFKKLTAQEQKILQESAPLAQTRMQLLGEAPGLMRYIFVEAEDITHSESAINKLKDSAKKVLEVAAEVVAEIPENIDAEQVKQVLFNAIVEPLGVKPREAFAPLFVGITGTNASLPVFDSIAIIGADESAKRLRILAEKL